MSCITLALTTSSCDKFLDIEPKGKVIPKTVDDFRKLITSAYDAYPKHKSLATTRTDEVVLYTEENTFLTSVREIYRFNDQNADNSTQEFPYESFYKIVFYANHATLEGVKTMEPGSAKEQLLAEYYALKAMANFDLVNLYAKTYDKETAGHERGIVIENEVQIEEFKSPNTVAEVYAQIHSDIQRAKEHIQVDNYEVGKNYRFTRPAILALEARVHLYQRNYEDALKSAEEALTYKHQLQDLNQDNKTPVTSITSVESILALEDALDGQFRNIAYVSKDLIQAYDQENDLRFTSYFSKSGDKLTVEKTGLKDRKVSFRTAELYMIKAEALVQLNRLAEAKEALESLIAKRYKSDAATKLLSKISNFNQAQFLDFILEERFREFAFEGHRWFDLRRLNQKEIIHELDGKVYRLVENDIRYTLPFPKTAKQSNPNL